MLESLHPHLALGGDVVRHEVRTLNWQLLEDEGVDVIFLTTPHEASREWAPALLSRNIRVVDLRCGVAPAGDRKPRHLQI